MKQSISSIVSTISSQPPFNNCLIDCNQVDHLYQPSDPQGDPKQESSLIPLGETNAHQIVEPQPVASQGNGLIESSDSNSVKGRVSRASSSPSSKSTSSSGRRSRTNFTSNQIATMESVFYNSTHYPDVKCLTELSMKLGLPVNKIQIWFQNRRAKFRRNSK
ncbi:visual system homeobox 2-like [Tetranychus urticae]|uniref:visual system homeobox 2-like n=1 Tax=Tetranychus urticae TaxID=32264 RepID=UPI00077B9C64|nr:visual system homeobox 2-like [Tetranychus urticae]